MAQTQNPEELYDLLVHERPKLHSAHDGTTATASAVYNWSINTAVLQWLIDHLRPGFRTLETGCGYSTIVFAICGCHHTVVSPFPEEHQHINEWCRRHGVSVDTITYRTGPSDQVLPAQTTTPLDLVLIDGDHAVPVPFIDFHYTSDHLIKGGFLLVDDVQLPSVCQLSDFLDTETPRWSYMEQIARTRIYRKCVDGKVTGLLWNEQPFCAAEPPNDGLFYHGLRKLRRSLVHLTK
jgi:predicted O-methyltransferase YrrM